MILSLVLLEFDETGLKPSSRSAVAAASDLGDIHALIAGHNVGAIAEAAAKSLPVAKILVADSPTFHHSLAEPLADLLVDLSSNYSHLIAAATATGKSVMPRIAALLGVQSVSDVVGIIDHETFERPIYAGNASATVKSLDKKKILTIRGAKFNPVEIEGGNAAIEIVQAPQGNPRSAFISANLSKSERPELTAARVVISGGRGMQNGENFNLLAPIADLLNGAIGASRAAVDAGFAPNDYQVGQTGKIVAPDLYIAVGISGAIQHLAGMKDSKIIAAINKDPDAPIFQIADYGLVADLFDALPVLKGELEKQTEE
jgi:electron transfer flavoprotein alpha subunit